MNKKGITTGIIVLIIVGISFFGYIISNNVYVTYDIVGMEKGEFGYECENNQVILTSLNFSMPNVRANPEDRCSQMCMLNSNNWRNYFKEKQIVKCNENNEPVCECKASVYTYYITPLF